MSYKKRKRIVISIAGVLCSAIIQYGTLYIMRDDSPLQQTAVLLCADIALILIVDKVKPGLYYN